MLVGSFDHSLDDKSRVFIPAKFRDDLGKQVVLVNGIGKCIYVFSVDGWNTFAGEFMQLSISNKVKRQLYASADEREPDKQGRIVLSANLKKHAGIDTDVKIIGYQNKMEIWSKEEWEKYSADADEEFDEKAMEILEGSGLGI